MMKILGGKYKGHNLKTPKSNLTRPTSSKVRESIFNILQNEIEDARVLDLFAGSGSIGIEALSRGAKTVSFVEKNRIACQCIRDNLHSISEHATILCMEANQALKKLTKDHAQFDLIYIDPPYALDFSSLLPFVPPLLAPGGTLMVEQPKRQTLSIPGLTQCSERTFGDTIVLIFSL